MEGHPNNASSFWSLTTSLRYDSQFIGDPTRCRGPMIGDVKEKVATILHLTTATNLGHLQQSSKI